MNKPPIKNYEEKVEWLAKYQSVAWVNMICSGCGETIYDKVNFAHNLSRTDDNIVMLPLFIDSLLNGSLQHNHCNVNHKQPKYDGANKIAILGSRFLDKGIDFGNYDEFTRIKRLYITEYNKGFKFEVAEQFERFLEANPEFAKYVNCEG